LPIGTLLLIALLPAALPAQVAHQTKTVHNDQVDLSVETFGAPASAIPVIAVNGGPGLSHAYMMQNDLWKRVARHRLVVLYDQRGTGGSQHVQAGAAQTMDAQVADLESIRAALALDRIAVLGDSYGGMIAMAYAAVHPEHIARLILSDSAAPAWKDIVHVLPQVFPDREEAGEAEAKRLALTNPQAVAQAGLVNHFRMIFYSPEKRDAYIAHMGDLGFAPAVADAVQKANSDLDLTPKLASFHFPTLIITGRFDMNVAPLTAWRMAHEIPGAHIVFFEKSGHLPAYEEPEKYLRVLEAFLDAA
jgi:proline iminopeptidase